LRPIGRAQPSASRASRDDRASGRGAFDPTASASSQSVTLKTAAARIAIAKRLWKRCQTGKGVDPPPSLQAETTAYRGGLSLKKSSGAQCPCGLAGGARAAQRTCNGLTQELAACGDRLSPQDAEAVLLQREENEICVRRSRKSARRSFAPQAAPSRPLRRRRGEERLDRGFNSQKPRRTRRDRFKLNSLSRNPTRKSAAFWVQALVRFVQRVETTVLQVCFLVNC